MPSRHLLCDSPADLLGTLRLLWRGWRNPGEMGTQVTRPLTIVFPTPIHRAACKRHLLEHGLSLFNVSLLLPNHLRTRLGATLLAAPERAPLWGREELDFLLRETAARSVAHLGLDEEENPAPLCRALARNAAPLRTALDELTVAGHSFRSFLAAEERDHSHLAPLRRAWEEIEESMAPGLRARRDRLVFEAAAARPRSIPGTLVLFNCGIRQSADFSLLGAALRAWEESAVLTLLAAGQEETVEGPWFDLVEQALPGASSRLPEQDEAFAPSSAPAAPRFHITPGGEDLAQLIVRQTTVWLSESPSSAAPSHDSPIGLVFPQDSPVASRVAQLLRARDIPFHSAFSTPLPLRFEQAILADWIALQQDDLWAEPFLLFWRKVITIRAFADRFGEPQLWGGELGRALAEAYTRMPNDHVAVLAAVAAQRKPLPALDKFLKWWNGPQGEGRWPAEAPLRDYLDRLSAQLDLLVGPLGKQIRGFLSRELTRLASEWRRPVSREAACSLLLSFVTRREETRDASEWAPVHLLSPEAARGLPWRRLLLAEVTERQWPRPDAGKSGSSPLLSDALRERLNAQVRRPSPSGEGAGKSEESYLPGTAPLLTGLVHAHLERETFAALLDGGAEEIVLCSAAANEIDGARELHPSEFFRQAWEAHRGPWNDGLPALLLKAADMKAADPTPARPSTDSPALDAVAQARRARTDPQTAFNEFSFLLRSGPGKPNPLAEITARAAEATLRDPATAWFAHALRLDANERERPEWTEESRWALFQGNLLHRLIEQSITRLRPATAEGLHLGSRWIPIPEIAAWDAALAASLAEGEAELRRAFTAARREPPRWWRSEWQRLATHVGQLARKCRAQLPAAFTHIAVEIPLTPPLSDSAGGGESVLPPLLWKGKADLVALDAPTPEEATRAVVIDFKTGENARDFSPGETAREGTYFQLVVYAALLRATWPHLRETHALVLHRGAEEPAAPVEVDPADPAFAPLWAVLREAWIEGRWGQFLALRERFTQKKAVPLALLDIPAKTLAAKWARTPGLSVWERGKKSA
ncbi:PD-(D/E)XK nuclease superfamily protein [Verrucomicrobium sp. GAS474]|uniref:PD-(D/E)XK nuclease family protein n=1 Tax=Verrucomicrobium sp. GAS474 TaxID=1882831 RepID=UPI00087AA940|nr:PD-(D/E)XK nuclease family protein [Verrucomicrobium sp. GAS474]SDU26394.1 PD-(D/E)XK nuclease superfamily protein [Verrucomicrobium sp. GAS474]